MSVTTVITATCNTAGCGKDFTVSGENVSKRNLKIGARKAGWLMKGRAVQLCPAHRPSAVKKEKAPKAKGAKASKAKVIAKARGGTAKKLNGSGKASAPVGGQSIGKLAKSAKVPPAAGAE